MAEFILLHLSRHTVLYMSQTLPDSPTLRSLDHYLDVVGISVVDKAAGRTTVLTANAEVVIQEIGFFSKSLQQQRVKIESAFASYTAELQGNPHTPLPSALQKGMALHVNCDLDVFMWLLQYAEARSQRRGLPVSLGKIRVKPLKKKPEVVGDAVGGNADTIAAPDILADMVVSLALSSRFLQMNDLCLEACSFLCANLGEVLMSDVNCDCIPDKEIVDDLLLGKGLLTIPNLLDGALYVACATRTNVLECVGWGKDGNTKTSTLRKYLTAAIGGGKLPTQAAAPRATECPNRAFLSKLLHKLLIKTVSTETSSTAIGFCHYCGLFTQIDECVIQRCPSLRLEGIGPRGEVSESHVLTDSVVVGHDSTLLNLFVQASLDGAKRGPKFDPSLPSVPQAVSSSGHSISQRAVFEAVEKCRKALHARSSSGPTEKEASGVVAGQSANDEIFQRCPALFPLQTFFREGELFAVIVLLQLILMRPSQESVALSALPEGVSVERELQELGIPSKRVTLSSTRYAASVMALRQHPLLLTFEGVNNASSGCALGAKLLIPRKLEKHFPNLFSCVVPTTAASTAPATKGSSANLFQSLTTEGADAITIGSCVQKARHPFALAVAARQRTLVARLEKRSQLGYMPVGSSSGSEDDDDLLPMNLDATGDTASASGPLYEAARAKVLSNPEKAAQSPAFVLLDLACMRDVHVFRGIPAYESTNVLSQQQPSSRKPPTGYQRPQTTNMGPRPSTSNETLLTPRLGMSVRKTTPASFREPRPPGVRR